MNLADALGSLAHPRVELDVALDSQIFIAVSQTRITNASRNPLNGTLRKLR